jgi:hypothetical protein
MVPQIQRIESSPRKGKKYRAFFADGAKIDFGSDTSSTYLDNHDKNKRKAYWARHYANNTERELLNWFVPSPATLSAVILWGSTTDLKKNVDELNSIWRNLFIRHAII